MIPKKILLKNDLSESYIIRTINEKSIDSDIKKFTDLSESVYYKNINKEIHLNSGSVYKSWTPWSLNKSQGIYEKYPQGTYLVENIKKSIIGFFGIVPLQSEKYYQKVLSYEIGDETIKKEHISAKPTKFWYIIDYCFDWNHHSEFKYRVLHLIFLVTVIEDWLNQVGFHDDDIVFLSAEVWSIFGKNELRAGENFSPRVPITEIKKETQLKRGKFQFSQIFSDRDESIVVYHAGYSIGDIRKILDIRKNKVKKILASKDIWYKV